MADAAGPTFRKFEDDFSTLATVPCDAGHEGMMLEFLVEILKQFPCDIRIDQGNLLAYRGTPTLALSAHHDKVMACHWDQCGEYFFRREKGSWKEEIGWGPYGMLYLNINGNVEGHCDNALGVALAIDALRNTDNLLIALTTGEEQGMTGATYLAQELGKRAPEGIIVLDCESPLNGTGVIMNVTDGLLTLEHLCNVGHLVKKRKQGNALADDIQHYATAHNQPITRCPYTYTELQVYERRTDVPCVALGIPVHNMHEHFEKCSEKDLLALHTLLLSYLRHREETKHATAPTDLRQCEHAAHP